MLCRYNPVGAGSRAHGDALQAGEQVVDSIAKAGTAVPAALVSACSDSASQAALDLVYACCRSSEEAAADLVGAGVLQVF